MKKLIELYEPRIKKAEDMVAQLVAVQNRHDETVQACRDKLAKHMEQQVELNERWDELNQRIDKTQSDINGRSVRHKDKATSRPCVQLTCIGGTQSRSSDQDVAN